MNNSGVKSGRVEQKKRENKVGDRRRRRRIRSRNLIRNPGVLRKKEKNHCRKHMLVYIWWHSNGNSFQIEKQTQIHITPIIRHSWWYKRDKSTKESAHANTKWNSWTVSWKENKHEIKLTSASIMTHTTGKRARWTRYGIMERWRQSIYTIYLFNRLVRKKHNSHSGASRLILFFM